MAEHGTAGTVTLPDGLPARTLGWGVIRHASTFIRQPNGVQAGQLWTPTDSQARFLLWWYALDEDGRFLYHHGVRRLVKGSGKSPLAAVMSLAELTGPVRLAYLDPAAPGGAVGQPVAMPLVQIAATAESQTANTMRMVRAMAAKGSRLVREYSIDVGKTIFYTPSGGQLEVITSSAAAAEGAEPTFVVEDETEHWVPANGGPTLSATLDRNLAKSSSRALETANAWEPGTGSVAEASYDAWVLQQEGRTRGSSRILYDARVAPDDTNLADEASLDRGLAFAYGDCFWVDLATIKGRIWDPRTQPDVARRYYLNQPTATQDSWLTPQQWGRLADPTQVVADGDNIVLFFDGSKSRDATALVGCRLSDGHTFTVGVWEPDTAHTTASVVPVAAVDAAVEQAFARWKVWAFYADVAEWDGFAKVTWPGRYGADLPVWAQKTGNDPQAIAWDMRSHTQQFTLACELAYDEIVSKGFSHDGDSRVARHVANARRRPNRWGISIGKESRDSAKKVDAAVCVVGARMVRRLVLASPEWAKRKAKRSAPKRIY